MALTWYTYFIQAVDGGLIKIGRSTDVEARLRSHQIGCPLKLRLLATITGDRESAYHSKFMAFREHGEWFRPAQPILDEIQLITEGNEPQQDPRVSLLIDDISQELLDGIDLIGAILSEKFGRGIPRAGVVATCLWHTVRSVRDGILEPEFGNFRLKIHPDIREELGRLKAKSLLLDEERGKWADAKQRLMNMVNEWAKAADTWRQRND